MKPVLCVPDAPERSNVSGDTQTRESSPQAFRTPFPGTLESAQGFQCWLAEHLQSYRTREGLSIARLAARLQFQALKVSRWLRTERFPSIREAERLDEFFHLQGQLIAAHERLRPRRKPKMIIMTLEQASKQIGAEKL